MCFESSNLHDIKKWQMQGKNFKSLKKKFEVSIKIFCRKWEGKNLLKRFFIYKQLDKCQNKCYPNNSNLIRFCRRVSLHLPMFPISLLKRNFWSYWK